MTEKNDDGTMPFLSHLKELRSRLKFCVIAVVVGFIIGYIVYEPVTYYLLKPLYDNPHIQINFPVILGPFAAKLKISMYIGFFIAVPFCDASNVGD